MTLCKELRVECDAIFEANFNHPFIEELATGTLSEDIFKEYILQDSYYLQHYAKVHALAAAQATDMHTVRRFAQHAEGTCGAEIDLHESYFSLLGVTEQDLAKFKPAPTAYAYTSHLYRAAMEGDLAATLAALLPCYWVYYEIGERLKEATPNHPIYDKWIAMYSSEWFEQSTNEQIERLNELTKDLSQKRRAEIKAHFIKSCHYELQFWEMAYTKQNWDLEKVELQV
ncbi:thiaminase II [Sporosarcina sp. ITBMC105]